MNARQGFRRTVRLLAPATLVIAACSAPSTGSTSGTVALGAESTTTNTAASTRAATTTTTTTTTIAATTTEVPQPIHITMAFSGDVLVHTSIWKRAQLYAGGQGYDFRPMFADIEPLVSSTDLAICHLEVPIAPDGEPPQTYPNFGAPKEIVAGIASAGYDRCSTASNHSLDQGFAGIQATVNAFEEQGIGQSGMARDAAEAEPHLIDVKGVKVAHLAYTRGYPTLNLPPEQAWWANDINVDRILADARKARDMGAQIVVVSMHWGTESASEPSETQVTQAEALTASGLIDLIVGHHAHVVQPIEQLHGVWIVFGMGNSISNMPVGPYPPPSQDGVVVEVGFDVAFDGKVTVERPVVYPTVVDKSYTFEIRDVLKGLARTDITERERAMYESSLARTSSLLGDFIATAPFTG